MTRPACKYEDGRLWWRGSNEAWRWKPDDEARALAKVFRECPDGDYFKPIATRYAEQIEAALAEYDAQENEDEELRYITETEHAHG